MDYRYFLAIDKHLNSYSINVLNTNYLWKEIIGGDIKDRRYELKTINGVTFTKNIMYDSREYELRKCLHLYKDKKYGWQPCTKLMEDFIRGDIYTSDIFYWADKDSIYIKPYDITVKITSDPKVSVNYSEKMYNFNDSIPKKFNYDELDQVMFCVHGIARKSYEFTYYERSIQRFNERLLKSGIRILLVPITWNADLNNSYVKDLFYKRNIYYKLIKKSTNEIMYYVCCQENRDKLYDEVITKINNTYDIINSKMRIQDSNILAFGHSMGSIILSDILTDKTQYNKLIRKPIAYIASGSPWPLTSMFLGNMDRNFINMKLFMNIIYNNDPLAYFYSKYFSGEKQYIILNNGNEVSDKSNRDDNKNPIDKNIDFVIQSNSFLDNIIDTSLLSPIDHVSYFNNNQVIEFLIQKIIQIQNL